MDLASACPLCGRAVGNTGYMVVERAYWYHDCGAPGLTAGAPAFGQQTLNGNHVAPALPAGGRPTLVDGLFQPRLRLTISPATDSATIQQFSSALSENAAVRGVELEQFIGQMAVLAVEASSLSELITALLNTPAFPVTGLTVTPDGQLSVRLDEQTLARRTLPRPEPVVAPPPPAEGPAPLSDLQARVQRLARDLGALVARVPSDAPAPVETSIGPAAPAPPPAEPTFAPFTAAPSPADDRLWTSAADSDAAPAAEPEPHPTLGAHVWQALDRLAALRQEAAAETDAADAPLTVDDRDDPTGDTHEDGERPAYASEVDDAPATEREPYSPEPAPLTSTPAYDRAPTTLFRTLTPVLDPDEEAAPAVAPARELWQEQPAAPATPRPAPGTPQSVQVVAYPFANFSSVNSFINAVRLLPDVRYVAPRRFRAGTIQLAVDYIGEEPLSTRLRTLGGFTPSIVAEDEESVTLSIGGGE